MTYDVPGCRYEPAEDLWLLTAYFNPMGYETKARNYGLFRDAVKRSGLHLLTIECAFGRQPFTLPGASDVLQIRAKHVMWQKERLLNLALASLPPDCLKVAWVDCDILFSNPAWAAETSSRLDDVPVVQPFTSAIRLPP